MTNTISILGSTGSIGRQTLSVAEELGLRVAALTAEKNVDLLEAQCRKYRPELAVMTENAAAEELKTRLADMNIRVLAGSEALKVAERVFAPASGKKLSDYPANTAVHGVFSSSDGEFDDGMCVFFRAPRSFTGEDIAELYCHGGLLVTKKLLEAVIEAGASYAGPGEFTRRAFINGKLTLTEAEAVGDMIDAVSEAHLGAGLKRLRGALSKRVGEVYDTLRHLAASAYAFIDYPDEDLADVPVDEMKKTLEECYNILHSMWKTSRYGRAISDGVPAAIIGRPNTGKSSLLNLLCGSERAIVTDIEGTTRDVITERVVSAGSCCFPCAMSRERKCSSAPLTSSS